MRRSHLGPYLHFRSTQHVMVPTTSTPSPRYADGGRFQMFIVHVVRQFHLGVGGLENVVLELVSAQMASGEKVRVVRGS